MKHFIKKLLRESLIREGNKRDRNELASYIIDLNNEILVAKNNGDDKAVGYLTKDLKKAKADLAELKLEWHIENLTNSFKDGEYYPDYDTDGNEVSYVAAVIDKDKKFTYSLYAKQKLLLYGYDKGDGTTGPGMGDLGEFKYEDLTNGIEVEVFEYIAGDYSNYEDVSYEFPREPMFKFNYKNEDIFYNIFDNEEIEKKVRYNEGTY